MTLSKNAPTNKSYAHTVVLKKTIGTKSGDFAQRGDKGFYFTFGGHTGYGGGAGISSGVVSPSVGQTFGINDFEGMGSSVNFNLGLGPVGLGFE